MKKAGCYSVIFGIESADRQILKNIKKNETIEDVEKAIRMASKIGLMTQGFFILGLPGDTETTVKNTIDFAMRMPLDWAYFAFVDLWPGSEMWEQYKSEYKIDYSNTKSTEVKWYPKTIDQDKLRKLKKEAYRKFFLRPRPIWALIKHIKPSQAKHILDRIIDFGIISLGISKGKSD